MIWSCMKTPRRKYGERIMNCSQKENEEDQQKDDTIIILEKILYYH